MNRPKERCEEIVSIIIKSEPAFFKELNTKTLAKMYGIHRIYLSKTFKQYQKMNLNTYIKRLRIMKSSLLLMENKNLKIVDISYYFGWPRPECFIEDFKKFFGVTPGKFRDLVQI